MDRIEGAWRDNPLLSGLLATSAEEMEEAMGLSVASLAAWGDAEDADAIEAFVCGCAHTEGSRYASTYTVNSEDRNDPGTIRDYTTTHDDPYLSIHDHHARARIRNKWE